MKLILELLARLAVYIAAAGWGFSKAQELDAKETIKATEDANEIRHKVRTNDEYRSHVRDVFDKR